MHLNKIPATVVTGFLGSGKTTLLANLIRRANGKRIAVIVNEFGAIDIDADLLRSCPLDCEETTLSNQREDGIYELANGCICCTVEEEFLPVMKRLVARRDSIDHILIETSGLALPKPLVQAFNWPDIKMHFTVDAVITVVDGPAVAAGRFADDPHAVETLRQADANLDHHPSLHELLEDQLIAADLVVISKDDLLDPAERLQVEAQIKRCVGKEVKTVHAVQGQLAPELVFGLEAAAEERLDHVHTHHDAHHEHGEHHRHAHEDFTSCSIELGEVDSDRLLTILQDLITRHTIYRAKGFAALPGKPLRQVIQGVGPRFDRYFDRAWQPGEARRTRLTIIGQDLDPSALQQALAAAAVN